VTNLRRPLPGRFGWAAVVVGLSIATSTLTRAVVFALSDHDPAGLLTLARTFGAGAVFDTLVALWVAFPVVGYLTLVSRERYPRRGQRILRRTGLALMIAGITFVVAAEVVFFDEFDGRFNFVAVDYLIYPTEVVTNIWQSYPLVWVIGGIGSVTALVLWLLRSKLAAFDQTDGPAMRGRWAVAAGYAVVLTAMTMLVSPRLARVSDDRVLNEVASSGYYTFWQAVLGRDAAYEGWYATRSNDAVMSRLQRLVGHATAGHALPANGRALNVVVVLEESFGSAFVSTLHPRDSLPITPSFDSLATEGTLLTHAYSTGNRTIRAIEATTASLPPLPGISIVRRPQSNNLFTLPSVLRANGYTTEFIYGGRALFDGMGSYARANGFSRIIEQSDFPSEAYKTAWGVADEVIFDRALGELDSLHATGTPFYSVILTVSNHKPYTYPAGHIPQDPNEHRRVFAVRYSDWALGRFMRAARTHAFFEHTLFVLMGDHGARVYGAAEIPLPSYEVPILFYKPGAVAAGRRVSSIASALDVPPTILGLLGIVGESKFFGRDLFGADSSAPGRALMTHNSDLALMQGTRMAVLGLRGATTVHAVDSGRTLRRITNPDSADRELIEDAIAYYQGADAIYRRGAFQFDSVHAPRAQRSSTSSASSPRLRSRVQRASASTARPAGLSMGTRRPDRASRTPGNMNSTGTLRRPIDAPTRPSRLSVSTPAPASTVGANFASSVSPMRARAGPSR
jgi:phosphoglycerol transferase MdoB-like AlkP superfamily enzyme